MIELYLNGINFKEYELKPGVIVNGMITKESQGKETEVRLIEYSAYEQLQKENERLQKLLSHELRENDKYRMENNGIILLREENELLKSKLLKVLDQRDKYILDNCYDYEEALEEIKEKNRIIKDIIE